MTEERGQKILTPLRTLRRMPVGGCQIRLTPRGQKTLTGGVRVF
jgi:hypothetical protein